MTTCEELQAAIREGRITPDESRRLYQVLAEIALRIWYDSHSNKSAEQGSSD